MLEKTLSSGRLSSASGSSWARRIPDWRVKAEAWGEVSRDSRRPIGAGEGESESVSSDTFKFLTIVAPFPFQKIR